MAFPFLLSDKTLYSSCLLILYISAILVFFTLHFIQAPYGRHRRSGWGPTIPPTLAWIFMESPTTLNSIPLYITGSHATSPRSLALFSVFLLHYIHRTCIYPFRIRSNSPPTAAAKKSTADGFPISIALMGFVFNLMNSYVQTRWVSHYAAYDEDRWFWWRFVGGLVVFVSGMATNVWADSVLMKLKAQSKGRYRVPKGGLYELVCCPNYFGEVVEWLGWAFMTWSWPGLGFLVYTCANLVPRARANRRWYVEKFGDEFPKNTKSVFPFIY